MNLGTLAKTGAPDVLSDAVRVLDERGWTQGVTKGPKGEVDILGAVAIAARAPVMQVDDRPDLLITVVPQARQPAALVAWEVLEYLCEGDPVEWNDRPERTVAEVRDVLTRASDRLRIALK